MARTAGCHHCRIHTAAVLWWTQSSLSTDCSPLHAPDLTEAASCHIGTDAVHAGRRHAGYRHAQPLVCSCRNRHFVVYVCRVSSVNTDYACKSGELCLLICVITCSTFHQSVNFQHYSISDLVVSEVVVCICQTFIRAHLSVIFHFLFCQLPTNIPIFGSFVSIAFDILTVSASIKHKSAFGRPGLRWPRNSFVVS